MKTFKKLSILFFLALLCVSCSSNDEDNPIEGSDGFLTAKIEGDSFSSIEISLSAIKSTNQNGTALNMQGSNSVGNFIGIGIFNYNGVGTYKTGNAVGNANSLTYGTVNPLESWISTLIAGDGTIEITAETDTHVEGTFTFTGEGKNNSTKTITEGKFRLPLTVQ